jgi:hypothetical protein
MSTNSSEQARAQLEYIVELLEAYDTVKDDVETLEKAEARIQENALSVEVRNGWRVAGTKCDDDPDEYRICLCTGGPAVQIIGSLNIYGEPETATLEHQDWGEQWEPFVAFSNDAEWSAPLKYARHFYYGDC